MCTVRWMLLATWQEDGCEWPTWTWENSSHQCPSGFSYTTRSSAPRSLCDYSGSGNCIGTNFAAHGLSYSHVYRRIIGYQNGYPIASYYYDFYNYNTLDTPYIFGVSLTHGQNPRNHIIWSFVGAADETTSSPSFICPCINLNINPSSTRIPSFIGSDYFCDTALSTHYTNYVFILVIHYGMEKGVAQLIPAVQVQVSVATTAHHGSSKTCHLSLLMTWS